MGSRCCPHRCFSHRPPPLELQPPPPCHLFFRYLRLLCKSTLTHSTSRLSRFDVYSEASETHHQLDPRRWTCAPGEAPRLTACAGDCTHREEEDVDEERLVATAAAALERQRIESLPFEERQQALQLYRRRGQGRTRRATRGSGNGTPRRQQRRRRRRRRGALDRWRRQAAWARSHSAASPC